MPEYYSYFNNTKDPTTSYEVGAGRIETYEMKRVFLGKFKRGPLKGTFSLDSSAKIIEEDINSSGKGGVLVRNSTSEVRFHVFEHGHEFLNEIKAQLS